MIVDGEKSANSITNSVTMSDDEAVASDVPRRYLFVLHIASVFLIDFQGSIAMA